MTLKIMSGVVLPLKKNGYVEIMFDDHTINHSSDANTAEKKTIGPAGNFIRVPTKIVALRQIEVLSLATPVVGGPTAPIKFKIVDSCNRQRLRITWFAGSPSKIEAISYMVIGEA